jgi:hypothetical protein
MELDQLANVKNAVHQENILIMKQASVDHAVMDSSNQTKVHSHAKFADLDKQLDQLKQNHDLNVAMNVHQVCNWELMENVSHVQEELTALKACNQHVNRVHWEEQHLKSAHQPLKNVHCQFVPQVLTSTPPLMSVSSAVKDIINPSHNKPHAYHAHQIIALRTLPQPQRLNVQILVKVPPKGISTVMPTHIAYSFQRHLTSSANVSQALMELEFIVQVRII